MAGRGTDIVLGGSPKTQIDALEKSQRGGAEAITTTGANGMSKWSPPAACISSTERHESRRIRQSMRGRSGRQGDPGSKPLLLVARRQFDAHFSATAARNYRMTGQACARRAIRCGTGLMKGASGRVAENAHQIVFERQVEAARARIAIDGRKRPRN